MRKLPLQSIFQNTDVDRQIFIYVVFRGSYAEIIETVCLQMPAYQFKKSPNTVDLDQAWKAPARSGK